MEEGKISPSQESIENIIVSPTYAHKVVAELVGTYVIVFTGCGCTIIDKRYRITIMGIAIGWGLAVMVMIYTLGHVSGGHFNPAVTIAFAASRKFPWRQVPAFVVSQLAGSTLAILTLSVLFHGRVDMHATVTQYLSPTTDLEALAWEFIISFILMLTICGVATDNRAINELSGVTVGATVLFNFLLAGQWDFQFVCTGIIINFLLSHEYNRSFHEPCKEHRPCTCFRRVSLSLGLYCGPHSWNHVCKCDLQSPPAALS